LKTILDLEFCKCFSKEEIRMYREEAGDNLKILKAKEIN
jgi:hypothetical protein